ncbi:MULTISPECIES: hypothetical protein [unclassified Streptomyces]|uniref:hypothetical protein n=1 Tax=unclassified Streptomyces TaxID=2593676 RepID=UPI003829E7F1
MQNERAETYAQCAADLEEAASPAAAASAFDTALTNGLVAIVAHEWNDEVANRAGHTKPASKLLDLLMEKAASEGKTAADKKTAVDPENPGIVVLPDPEPDKAAAAPAGTPWPWVEDGFELPPLDTRIDVMTLRDGLERTQPVRHARGIGTLERRHIDALLALDDHIALRCLASEHADRAWSNAREADAHARSRAADLLLRIGEEEAARRAQAARDLIEPYHPKHNPVSSPQLCPICGHESFQADAEDDHGMGVGIGRCLVCHYERSAEAADEDAQALVFEIRWANY